MAWEPLPVETDPDAATRRIITALQALIPGWKVVDGALDAAIAQEVGRESVLLHLLAAESAEYAVAGIGATVFGFAPSTATSATLDVTFTLATSDAVIPAGVVVIDRSGLVETAYRLDVEHAAQSITPTLTLRAVVPGATGNATLSGTPLVVVTATASVISAVAASDASGGQDAEAMTAYLSRLTSHLSTLSPSVVTSGDSAALARTVPGVARALGLDLYDPAQPGVTVERCVTVVPIDVDGEPVDGPTAAAVAAALEEAREVNFVVHTMEPTYTPVHVVFSGVAETGQDPAVVEASVVEAVSQWLSPARWGAPAGDPSGWVDSPLVRYNDLVRVAGSASGVAYIGSLTINGSADDFALAGPAALPASLDAGAPSTVVGSIA